jgi:MATE family multidrug resistance protein
MVVNLVGYWLVALPLSLWLGRGLHMGPVGLWWGFVVGLVVVALVVLARVRQRLRGDLTRIHVEGDHVPLLDE